MIRTNVADAESLVLALPFYIPRPLDLTLQKRQEQPLVFMTQENICIDIMSSVKFGLE